MKWENVQLKQANAVAVHRTNYESGRHIDFLAATTDPFFKFPFSIDNATLERSSLWPAVRDCPDAHNCRSCGKCDALLSELKFCAKRIDGSGLTRSFADFFKG